MRRQIDAAGRMGGYDNEVEFECPKGLCLEGDGGVVEAHWKRGKNGKLRIHKIEGVSMNGEERDEEKSRYADGNEGADDSGQDRLNLRAIDEMGKSSQSKA